MTEIWKDVVGYEGLYKVSNMGNVRSLFRVIVRSDGRKRTINGGLLSPSNGGGGYSLVTLSRGGKHKKGKVHRLVAEAFIGLNARKPCVNHKNGVKTDNRVGNLEWTTVGDNIRHAFKTGLNPKGEKHHLAKLTIKDVNKIKLLLAEGDLFYREIADMFGVGETAIGDIKRGKRWTHVNP